MCYDRALLPSIICLSRLRIASKCIFDLWQLRQGVDSLTQWLELWIFIREDGFDSHERWNIFSAMLHSFVTTFMEGTFSHGAIQTLALHLLVPYHDFHDNNIIENESSVVLSYQPCRGRKCLKNNCGQSSPDRSLHVRSLIRSQISAQRVIAYCW